MFLSGMLANIKRIPISIVIVIFSVLVSLVILLAIPYSFGLGTDSYSLAQYFLNTWRGDSEMQHGLLVIPAFIFLIYYDRERLSKIPVYGSPLGIFIMIFGMLLFWSGRRADVTTVGIVSLWLILQGSVLWVLGFKMLKALSFPLIFLLFALPIPGLDTLITFPLRMIMSKASFEVLNLIGVPVILQGTGILSAPNPLLGIPAGKLFSVDVADPCSGIRSLFALMMVSALYAHFTLKTWWQKWILFLCSIPLAVLGNLFRILTLTFGVMAFGSEFAIGKNALTDPSWFHMAAGYVVFAVALGGMIGISGILSWIYKGDWRKWWKRASDNSRSTPIKPVTDIQRPTRRKEDIY